MNIKQQTRVEYLLCFAKMAVNVGSNVGHGGQVLIILLHANSSVLELDVQ